MKPFRILLFLFSVLLAGCFPHKPGMRPLSLARGVPFVTPEPDSLGRSLLATQKWIVHGGTKTYRFTAYLEVTPEKIVLVGMTPAGTRGFLIAREKGGFLYEHLPFFRLPIEPRIMLAHAQLAFWPEDVVRRGLEPKTRLKSTARKRVLLRGRREIINIEYEREEPWRGTVRIHNPAKGRLLEIKTIRTERLR